MTKRLLVLACVLSCLGWKAFSKQSDAPPGTVVVDLGVRFQTIDGLGGFGPAKPWWEDPPHFDARYLDRIVGELGTSVVRTQLYWDFEPANDDDNPRHLEPGRFNLRPDSGNGKQLAFIRAVGARGVKVIASVWTPPVWMKRDPDDRPAPFCHGQCGGHLDPSMRDEFAEYLVAYVKMLKAETGVDLYALSLQNEPLFAEGYESCVYTEADYAATLKVVGARLHAERLKTKVFGPEHMGSFKWNAAFFARLLDDSEAARDLDIYAVHSYLDGVSADYGSAEGWTRMSERVAAAGKPLWMTETSGYDGSWGQAFETARGLHLALRYGHVEGWVYWYFAGNLLVKGEPTPLFYALASYYRFVRPGAVQVASSAGDADVLVTAFRRGGSLTLVLINSGAHERRVALHVTGGPLPTPLTAYRTSERDKLAALGRVDARAIILAPSSITTLVAGGPP
jgi:O-glycosyl hydrolase